MLDTEIAAVIEFFTKKHAYVSFSAHCRVAHLNASNIHNALKDKRSLSVVRSHALGAALGMTVVEEGSSNAIKFAGGVTISLKLKISELEDLCNVIARVPQKITEVMAVAAIEPGVEFNAGLVLKMDGGEGFISIWFEEPVTADLLKKAVEFINVKTRLATVTPLEWTRAFCPVVNMGSVWQVLAQRAIPFFEK